MKKVSRFLILLILALTIGLGLTACGEVTTYGIWEVSKSPTLTEAGSITRTVTEGKNTRKETLELPKLSDEAYKVTIIEATCQKTGNKTYLINVADNKFTFEELLPKINLIKHEAKKASFDEPGNIEYWECPKCNKLYKSNEAKPENIITDVSLPKHTLAKVEGTPATCTATGLKDYYKGSNGLNYEDELHTKVIENLDEWRVIPKVQLVYVEKVLATDTEDGILAHYKCPVCGKLYKTNEATPENEISLDELKIPHQKLSFTEVKGVEATCKVPGVKAHFVGSDGRLYLEKDNNTLVSEEELIIEKIALTHVEAKEQTFEEDGNVEYWECPKCHTKYSKNEAADSNIIEEVLIPHYTLTKVEGKPATCTSTGLKDYYIGSNGINYADAAHTTPITEDLATWRFIPIFTLTHVPAKKQTFEEDGNVEYWECPDCHIKYNKNEAKVENIIVDVIIPHYTLTKVEGKPATCTTTGLKDYYVGSNGVNYTDETHTTPITEELEAWRFIPILTLTHVPAKKQTFEEDGNVEYWECPDCHIKYNKNEAKVENIIVDVLIPRYTLTKVEGKPATCTKTGLKDYYIGSNGVNYTDLSHTTPVPDDLEAWRVIPILTLTHILAKDPSFEENGNIEYWECPDCHIKYNKNEAKVENIIVDVLIPHYTLTKVEGKPATCTTTGLKDYYVGSNGVNYTDETHTTPVPEDLATWRVTPILTLTHVPAKKQTFEEDGNIEYWECPDCHIKYSKNEAKVENILGNVLIPRYTLTYVAGREATCQGFGLKAYYVGSNGINYTDETHTTPITGDLDDWRFIDKIALVKVDRVEPTFTSVGYEEHYKCPKCGTIYASHEASDENKTELHTIPILTKIKIEGKPATVNEKGLMTYYAGSNGKYYEDEACTIEILLPQTILPKLDVVKAPAREATYGAAGNKEYYFEALNPENKYFKDANGFYNQIFNDEHIIPELLGSITIYLNGELFEKKLMHAKNEQVSITMLTDFVKTEDFNKIKVYSNKDTRPQDEINVLEQFIGINQEVTVYVHAVYLVTIITGGLDDYSQEIEFKNNAMTYACIKTPTLPGYHFNGFRRGKAPLKLTDPFAFKDLILYCSWCLNGLNFEKTVIDFRIGLKLLKYDGNQENIVIPDRVYEYDNLPVIEIGETAFQRNYSIVSVTFPETIYKISDQAFDFCRNLERISFPENSKLETIGRAAFHYTSLKKVDFPRSVKHIGNSAFASNSGLSQINFPEDSRLEQLDYGAFEACAIREFVMPKNVNDATAPLKNNVELVSFTFSSNVTVITSEYFSGCYNLKNVIIPEDSKIKIIRDKAFENCYSLEELILPKLVEEIDYNVGSYEYSDGTQGLNKSPFWKTPNLRNIYLDSNNKFYRAENNCLIELKTMRLIGGFDTNRVPDGVKIVERKAFTNNNWVTDVYIPGSVKTIYDRTFLSCPKLRNITLGDGVEEILSRPVRDCENIRQLHIPRSVKTILDKPLDNRNLIDTVSIDRDNKFFTVENGALIRLENLEIVQGSNSCTEIPYFVKSIGTKAFEGYQNTTIKLNNGLKIIGIGAFMGSRLENVDFPRSLEEILSSAFCNSNFNTVYLNTGLRRVDYFAFDDNPNLSYVEVPITIEYFEAPFTNPKTTLKINRSSYGLSEYYLDEGTCREVFTANFRIGEQVSCNNWREDAPARGVVVIPQDYVGGTVREINPNVFSNAIYLDAVYLPRTIRKIGYNAFKGANPQCKIYIDGFHQELLDTIAEWNPDGLQVFWDHGDGPIIERVYGGNHLITVPASAEGIYDIPLEVTSIQKDAFVNCKNITGVYIHEHVHWIDSQAIPSNITVYSAQPNEKAFVEQLSSENPKDWNPGNPIVYSPNIGYKMVVNPETQKREAYAYCTNKEITEMPNIPIYFYYFENFQTLGIPIVGILENGFKDCKKMKNIKIPDHIKTIGDGAFSGCSSVSEIDFRNRKDHLTFGAYAFSGCDSLTEIEFLKTDDFFTLGAYAFSNCKNLTKVNYYSHLDINIVEGLFANCSKLESVLLSSKTTTIGANAFAGCKALKEIEIYKAIVNIGANTFKDCDNLTIIAKMLEADKPTTWDPAFNSSNRPIIWQI